MTENNRPNPTSDADRSDDRKQDDRSSLDRLESLARKVLRAPKPDAAPRNVK